MKYFDTSVIVLSILNDPRRDKALRELEGGGITSELGFVELVSYLSRNVPDPLPSAVNILYRFNISVRSLSGIRNSPMGNLSEVVHYALRIAEEVKLRTLDLLHVSYAVLLGSRELVTADREFQKAEDFLSRHGVQAKILE
ncbi:type II toxin-antitoxin system VapC family toxin [Metallosphaera javensis (ex Sakai et al. 2022)]|uniref:type II toxin-antitoxin system VapC family toxin n=1 Tax=Metallosphaera javensis (ex Sakai et al. 2022) TaxID=2775498 RepID=UPI00258C0A91|nr:MAG: tRNA(fMet)-specific endonuclease VapC [Metallosphaera javensis (ex Sakai et al. 2022)]